MTHRRPTATLALVCALATVGAFSASVLSAQRTLIETVPAATLLIPAFKVDVSNDACTRQDSLTTLFSISNESPGSTIAHVTLWTDQAVPAMTFDIYLTGYDIQTINLRDIFCIGRLPQTGPAVSDHGDLSGQPVNFETCNNTPTPDVNGPNYANPFSNSLRLLLREWFTGQPSSAVETCAGSGQLGDNIAVGYLTIDQTTQCTLLAPSDPAYFAAGGPLGFENILHGDYFYQDVANAFAQGFNAVHIEAMAEGVILDGEHTFYGRYEDGLATNRREPLPTTFKTRFALGGAFDATTLNVWRESDATSASYDCLANGPGWWPLDQANAAGVGPLIVFNEQEDSFVPPGPVPPSATAPLAKDHTEPVGFYFRDAVSIVPVGTTSGHPRGLPTGGFSFGSIYMNLQSSASVYGTDVTQAWVSTQIEASGRYSVGLDAVQLDHAGNPVLGNP